jgi:hypothetical protein
MFPFTIGEKQEHFKLIFHDSIFRRLWLKEGLEIWRNLGSNRCRRGSLMLVFWEQRLVFLATPKAGSTAIAAALEPLAAVSIQRPPVLKHTNVRRYHRFIEPYLNKASGAEFTSVALMREPIDWLASWYRFRRRDDLTDPSASTRDLSFDDFARAYCMTPRPAVADVGAQSMFLSPPGKRRVDQIFRYEDIDRFIAFLEERLNFEIELPRVNISPQAETTLSPATRRLLETTMAPDFELYHSLTG